MNSWAYYKEMWLKCTNFSGRATRGEFWYACLTNLGIVAIVCSLSGIFGFLSLIGRLYAIALVVPLIALHARRLHDVGKPVLLCIVPTIALVFSIVFFLMGIFGPFLLTVMGGICSIAALVTFAYLIFLLIRKGVGGANQYGADPHNGTVGMSVFERRRWETSNK